MIDFRSDTVTKPTKAMLNAMMNAEVGDDVFMEDPTINALEKKVADLFGKDAALFCSSGTMCNQIAIKVHTQPGDEVICSRLAHIYHYEGGGMAMNSGVTSKLMDCDRGRFTAEEVKKAINQDDIHKPRTSLVCIEDTCNKGGGSVWNQSEIDAIGKLCKKEKIAYHLDGARLFNALAVTNVSPKEYTKDLDSISLCLSKGLGAPVGSVLIGAADFINQARRVRKVFGGGMRQAGYLAAAAIYALDNNIERLKVDHQRAQEVAEKLEALPKIKNILPVETNIVIFNLNDGEDVNQFIDGMKEKGFHLIGMGGQAVRIVYHLDISGEDHKRFLEVLG